MDYTQSISGLKNLLEDRNVQSLPERDTVINTYCENQSFIHNVRQKNKPKLISNTKKESHLNIQISKPVSKKQPKFICDNCKEGKLSNKNRYCQECLNGHYRLKTIVCHNHSPNEPFENLYIYEDCQKGKFVKCCGVYHNPDDEFIEDINDENEHIE